MAGIVRKTREKLISEAYEARLAERERLITVLVEQIEYLRAQLNMPTHTVGMAAAPPQLLDLAELPEGVTLEQTQPLTDEEEELYAMKQAGVISEAEFEDFKSRLEQQSPDDIIE